MHHVSGGIAYCWRNDVLCIQLPRQDLGVLYDRQQISRVLTERLVGRIEVSPPVAIRSRVSLDLSALLSTFMWEEIGQPHTSWVTGFSACLQLCVFIDRGSPTLMPHPGFWEWFTGFC